MRRWSGDPVWQAGGGLIPVKLGARLTEVGHAGDVVRFEGQRPSLAAAVRIAEGGCGGDARRPSAVVSDEHAAQAAALVRQVFGTAESPFPPEELPSKLEQALGWAGIRGR